MAPKGFKSLNLSLVAEKLSAAEFGMRLNGQCVNWNPGRQRGCSKIVVGHAYPTPTNHPKTLFSYRLQTSGFKHHLTHRHPELWGLLQVDAGFREQRLVLFLLAPATARTPPSFDGIGYPCWRQRRRLELKIDCVRRAVVWLYTCEEDESRLARLSLILDVVLLSLLIILGRFLSIGSPCTQLFAAYRSCTEMYEPGWIVRDQKCNGIFFHLFHGAFDTPSVIDSDNFDDILIIWP